MLGHDLEIFCAKFQFSLEIDEKHALQINVSYTYTAGITKSNLFFVDFC